MAAVTDAERARLQGASPHAIGEAAVNGSIVFAPIASVECVGVVLDRATDRVQLLGSAVTLESYVWALQSGFALHAPNALVIKAVHQLDSALGVFRVAYPPRYVRDEIARLLAHLPARIEMDWPATALVLEPLRYTDAFSYDVERVKPLDSEVTTP
jgi:hypothetical protein